ncbi:hypothetical protein [Nitrosomonas aestuarii]|uniref:hypothetical protein n=1 Tax=Nitrosomonas aestuarii TaxID=52441 RepID=UPI000D312ABF|nr:hypothetical protein [Nitrosomonas aestuarii]PTN08884.1 hypothetical protein C8R11_12523 [Nitrosomonas aestuarii]
MLSIRSAALDRRPDAGLTAIDHHLEIIIQGTSEFIAPGEHRALDQPLTQTFDKTLAAWKSFLNDLALHHPSVRVIFSGRTHDYGNKLTTKELPRVPQVEIQPLTSEQVQNFLVVYSPDNAQHLWHQLKDSAQLELYRSPYYLKLLIDLASDGKIPDVRAALSSHLAVA